VGVPPGGGGGRGGGGGPGAAIPTARCAFGKTSVKISGTITITPTINTCSRKETHTVHGFLVFP
jgi:hypothetical protein